MYLTVHRITLIANWTMTALLVEPAPFFNLEAEAEPPPPPDLDQLHDKLRELLNEINVIQQDIDKYNDTNTTNTSNHVSTINNTTKSIEDIIIHK